MKTCKVCNITKPPSDFASHYSYKDGLDTRCKPCEKVRRDNKRLANKAFVRRYKVMCKCADCGFKGHHSAYDLAHIDRATKDCVSKGRHRSSVDYDWGRKRLKNEIKKCRVLCANCHRVETYKEGNNK